MATTPRTAKTTITSAAAISIKPLAAAVAGATAQATSPVQNQGTAGTNPDKSNPPQGFDGPSPNLSGVSKANASSFTPQSAADKQASVDQALGLVSQNAALQSLAGQGSGTAASQSEREKLTDLQGSIGTNKPSGIDQGFDSKPSNLGSNLVPNGKPMAAFQGVSAGDLLTTGVTNNGLATPTPGSGAAGSGLVSYDWSNPMGNTQRNAFEYARNKEDKISSDQRNKVTYDNDGTKHVYVKDDAGNFQKVGTISKDGDIKPVENKAGMPDPENTGSKVNIVTQSLLDQLNAAQAGKPGSKGGSGDTTPVTEGGIDPVVRNGNIAVNQASLQGRNLFGQPLPPGLRESGGGTSAANPWTGSNGAGVINPGNEAGNPGGDSRYLQDPGQALGGGQPASAPPSMPTSASEQRSSVSATLTAGIRNLTLTGSAAINGSGNSLDNLIIGNGAANELRGGAGNDSLNGGAGNDLLDGGSGRDLLTGGAGADRFRFATPGGFGTAQADQITDFSRSEGDRIEISRSAFGLDAGTTVSFQAVSSDLDLNRVLSTGTLLVQDLRDGSLLFNQNGSAAGAGLGGLFATVNPGFALQASDFALIG